MRWMIVVVLFMTFTNLKIYAQGDNKVEIYQTQYQACLDKGRDMVNCAALFYRQMDDLLNVYYQKLRSTCDQTQKETLKQEEIEWLAKRDAYFKKTLAESRKGGIKAVTPQDNEMVMFDKNAKFVKERVVELSKGKNTDYTLKK
jgi:uncharacterized protein YecT (DUF1311 family)